MRQRSRGTGGFGIRIIIAVVIGIFSLISYFSSQQTNPITGEKQYLTLTPEQEIALGLQAAPELINEYGGLYQDQEIQDLIDEIGERLVNESVARDTPWEFEFYVLDDRDTINAFALPGGQVFITTALLAEFENDDQIAGVLGHEIVHVLARHSAQRIAKSELTNGLIGAVGVASGNASATQTAAMIGQMINMSYGREDELESDSLGVCLMLDAGYDPRGMLSVQEILAASGGGGQPEFASSHPSPENRLARIQEAIDNADTICPRIEASAR
ncbi:MAG: M48 family metalloprotease [Armatimonadetes bacterium]|nr:M48 family metalloprotease [Anaerolineae bacterium]